MYCQACGAANSEDAKFCNQCGKGIARAGDVGGPVAAGSAAAPAAPAAPAPAAPPPSTPGAAPSGGGGQVNVWEQQSMHGGGTSMMSVSLEAIGVRSSKKVWAMLLLVALGLVALGALASWLLRADPKVAEGHARPEDPFVIGVPLPAGEALPETSEAVDEPAEPSATMTAMTTTTPTSTTGATTMTSTVMATTSTGGAATGGTTMDGTSTTTAATAGAATGTTGSTMTGTTGSATTGTTGGTATGGTSAGGDATGGATDSSATTMDSTTGGSTLPPTTGPVERDFEADFYASRVRSVINTYYAARAQACFDRATRNNPNVSGTIVVSMTVGADGHVRNTRVMRNTTGDETLGNCLSSQVASWQLPPPPGGSLEMQMPFSR